MARVTGPLMSFDASGSIAGAVVFSKWRGRNYVRRHAVPSNPRTTAQLAARSIIAFLGADWKNLDPADQASWQAGSESLKISPFNEYVRVNARNWRDQMPPTKLTPAALTNTPGTATSMAGVASGRQAQLTLTAGFGADDWGIVLCRSTTTGFTPTPGNAIIVAPSTGFAGVIVDGPLVPDTYYYRFAIFTDDGILGGFCSEEEVTIV